MTLTGSGPLKPCAVRYGPAICLALVVACVADGVWLRWGYLGAQFHHFDEVIPAALIVRFRAAGSLDLNVRDADVPPIFKHNQYTASSYHYAIIAWDAVTRHFPGWPDEHPPWPSPLRLRAFSAVLATAVLIGIALVSWRLLGPCGSVTATSLAAFNLTLVQDAHYARSEAWLTLLTVVFLWVLVPSRPFTFKRAAAAGIILGLLVASRITMGALGFVAIGCLSGERSARRSLAVGAVLAGTALASFLVTSPGAWQHYPEFRDGLATLETQYSHPFPIVGRQDVGTTYGMAADYFIATLGPAAAILAIAGVVFWLWRRAWRMLLVWCAPAAILGLYFGGKTIFFERAYSELLPGVFMMTAAGASAVAERGRPTLVLGIGLAALAAVPSALLSHRFVSTVLSGEADARRIAYDQRLVAAEKDIPLLETQMWMASQAAPWEERWRQDRRPFMLRVADYGDPWTAAAYGPFLNNVPAREFATIPGPFANLPVNSIPVYHVPTWHYVWVGEAPPPGLPQPAQSSRAAGP